MRGARRHQLNLVLRTDRAVHHAHEHHDADVVVEPGVDDEGLERRLRIALGRGNVAHDALENLVDAETRLRGTGNRIRRIDADHVLDFLGSGNRIRARKVHLVEDRDHGNAEINRGVAVGHCLRLNALRRIDDEERAFAGGERAAHFIGKVNMPRRVDEVELIDLSVLRLVAKRSRLGLDRNAALLLEIHAVEHLLAHFTVGEAAAALNQAVGKR